MTGTRYTSASAQGGHRRVGRRAAHRPVRQTAPIPIPRAASIPNRSSRRRRSQCRPMLGMQLTAGMPRRLGPGSYAVDYRARRHEHRHCECAQRACARQPRLRDVAGARRTRCAMDRCRARRWRIAACCNIASSYTGDAPCQDDGATARRAALSRPTSLTDGRDGLAPGPERRDHLHGSDDPCRTAKAARGHREPCVGLLHTARQTSTCRSSARAAPAARTCSSDPQGIVYDSSTRPGPWRGCAKCESPALSCNAGSGYAHHGQRHFSTARAEASPSAPTAVFPC